MEDSRQMSEPNKIKIHNTLLRSFQHFGTETSFTSHSRRLSSESDVNLFPLGNLLNHTFFNHPGFSFKTWSRKYSSKIASHLIKTVFKCANGHQQLHQNVKSLIRTIKLDIWLSQMLGQRSHEIDSVDPHDQQVRQREVIFKKNLTVILIPRCPICSKSSEN